ncbi:MAG: Bro-N domain-containing protein [Candidatus Gracilibacteria bacterium]|nr:Bro-N domain-containing protein [Candidatus Gracilibacteria bacterium]
MKETSQGIALFEGAEIRKVWQNGIWWFSILDIIMLLTESTDVNRTKDYIKKMRSRDEYLSTNWGTICPLLDMKGKDGKNRKISASNTQGALRIIQSIPSKRAEPFKQWLAKLGQERIDEINDPELTAKRMMETYEKKGYPKEWIDIRTRGIPVRKGLTNEWDVRGGEKAYGILTNEVYKAYSGMDNTEWKAKKGMKSGNLRDGMTPTELILTMLAEQATTDITKARDIEGLPALKKASRDGGGVAMKARKELMEQTGRDPISPENYLDTIKKGKKLAPKTTKKLT